ncbi:hypothetical protein Tco_0996154 [Tanacetum coccineum]
MLAQKSVITELQAADRRRQTVITEMLAADRRRQKQFTEALKLIKRLQTQMTEFERQQGPAKGPAQHQRAPRRLGNWHQSDGHEVGLDGPRPFTAVLAARDANTNGVDRTQFSETKRCCRYYLIGIVKMENCVAGIMETVCGNTISSSPLYSSGKGNALSVVESHGQDLVPSKPKKSKPNTMQEATEMAIKVMDKRIRTFADRQTKSKRKFEDTSRNT